MGDGRLLTLRRTTFQRNSWEYVDNLLTLQDLYLGGSAVHFNLTQ